MNLNKYTVDRFDDGFAVLLMKTDESNEKLVPAASFGDDVKEGDVLEVIFNENGTINKYTVLENETEEIRESVSLLIKKLKDK